MFIHVVVFLVLSLITFMCSVVNSAYDSATSGINILGIIIFLGGLSIYSYYQGRKHNKGYEKFIFVYIKVLIITGILALIIKIPFIAMLLFLNIISMYALTHFMEGFMNPYLVVIVSICLEFSLILAFYNFGKHNKILGESHDYEQS